MALERVWKGLLAIAALSVVFVLLAQLGVVPAPWTADSGEVQVIGDGDDEPKAVVDVAVADTAGEKYTGLSDHESLEAGEGMLFVYDDEDERTFVMREMDFDIDIIFIGADGEVTTIHHARAPEEGEDGEDLQYTGDARWVLEVPRGYANETEIETGDEVDIDLESERVSVTNLFPWMLDSSLEAAVTEARAADARTYFDS